MRFLRYVVSGQGHQRSQDIGVLVDSQPSTSAKLTSCRSSIRLLYLVFLFSSAYDSFQLNKTFKHRCRQSAAGGCCQLQQLRPAIHAEDVNLMYHENAADTH